MTALIRGGWGWWDDPAKSAVARAEMLAAGMQRCPRCDGPEEPPAPPEDPDPNRTGTPPLNTRLDDYTGYGGHRR